MIPVFIGGDVSVASERLLAILDFRYFDGGENRKYLARLQTGRLVVDASEGSPPRSLIVTDNEVYISAVSPFTLKKRADKLRREMCEFNFVEER